MRYAYPRITKHIPEYQETDSKGNPVSYGMFGYKGLSVEAALKNQDLDGIQKAHELGWINPDTPKHMQTLGGGSLVEWVSSRNLPLAAEKLISLGY